MTNPSHAEKLAVLAARLRSCPSQDNRFSEDRLLKTWEQCRQLSWDNGGEVRSPVMAALILHDEAFAQLLTNTERSQLLALLNVALERFEEKAYPANTFGKIIAASLKESI